MKFAAFIGICCMALLPWLLFGDLDQRMRPQSPIEWVLWSVAMLLIGWSGWMGHKELRRINSRKSEERAQRKADIQISTASEQKESA
jgi:hypothetical protein